MERRDLRSTVIHRPPKIHLNLHARLRLDVASLRFRLLFCQLVQGGFGPGLPLPTCSWYVLIMKGMAWQRLTLSEALRHSMKLRIVCEGCGHTVLKSPAGLATLYNLSYGTRVQAIVKRLVCSKCGAAGSRFRMLRMRHSNVLIQAKSSGPARY